MADNDMPDPSQTEDWQSLTGGMINSVYRKGEMVKRPVGSWSPATQQWLIWLQDRGFTGAPRLLQATPNYEIVSYLAGDAILRPWPEPIKQEAWMGELARWLRACHRASRGFNLENQAAFIWGPRESEPHTVVCHGDLGLWNCVHQNGQLQGVIDWDLARFGDPLDDLAQVALEAVPLRDSAEAAFGTTVDRSILYGRLQRLCHDYGACTLERLVQHLLEYLTRIANEISALADEGVQPFVSFVERGFIDDYEADRHFIQSHWLP